MSAHRIKSITGAHRDDVRLPFDIERLSVGEACSREFASVDRFFWPRRRLIMATAGIFVGAGVLAHAVDDQAVVIPIRQLVAGLLAVMRAGSSTPFQRRLNMLEPVIDSTFDLDAILVESVGVSWTTLPPDQQTMLMDAFRSYTVASYVHSFGDFRGQRFEINPIVRTVGTYLVVDTRIIPLSGEQHELDYVLRQRASGARIVDVLADGSISRVAVQRSDFRRLLARGGAQALAESLRIKSVDLSNGAN